MSSENGVNSVWRFGFSLHDVDDDADDNDNDNETDGRDGDIEQRRTMTNLTDFVWSSELTE